MATELTPGQKASRTAFLKRVKAFTAPEGGYTSPAVPERYSAGLGYDVVHGSDLEARDRALQRFQGEWEALTEDERAEALRDAHGARGVCKYCGNPIRQIPLDEVPALPSTQTAEGRQAQLDEIRAEVGDLVWTLVDEQSPRTYTCASASVYHEPAG